MARYNPSDASDYLEAIDFINNAKQQGFDIELRKFYAKRSNPQNNYLHFCLSWFANQYGCTAVEAKEVFLKRIAAPQIFERECKGITYYLSTSDLTTVEMAGALSNFIEYARINGIKIPPPKNLREIRACEREIEKTQQFGT